MKRTSAIVVCAVVCLTAAGVAANNDDHDKGGGEAFTFALIGDMPYGPEGDAKFPNVIADVNADRRLSFVVHDGDFKNGSSLCSDEVFQDRLDLFNAFRAPFIYVPGDNEWTDCHRANNGAYDPLERLALLRTMFYPTERSLGRRTIRLARQSADPQYALYRENVRWAQERILFVGVHVVGSNNNLGRTPEADAEYAARNAANVAWLRSSFGIARARGYQAVMVIMQANPGFELLPGQRGGFNDTVGVIEAETLAFGKPVVVVHGDSHYFRIDKPLLGTASRRRIEQLTRVETFGENDNHWLHVTVDPNDPNVFVLSQRIVRANLVDHTP